MSRNNPFYEKIDKYLRYVDDTYFIFSGTARNVTSFVNYINTCHKSITFTIENSKNQSLNFLDLTIYLDKNREIAFKVYRKPTVTDSIIPYDSNHPTSQEHAAIHAMAHRLHNIPMSKTDFMHELNVIHRICSVNGYPTYLINNIINKHKQKVKINNNNSNNIAHDKFICLKYFNEASHVVGNCFRENGYKVGFNTGKKTIDCIKNKARNPHNNFLKRSGIYKIECNDCDKIYIGKTERDFSTRFKEHIKRKTSNIYKHMNEKGHVINEDNLSVLHLSNDKRMLSVLEKFEIRKAMCNHKSLLNAQLDLESANSILIQKCCTL